MSFLSLALQSGSACPLLQPNVSVQFKHSKTNKEILVNPQAFKTPVIKTEAEVYAAADEVLTHPYFTPVHATIYGTIAGAKAGLVITPLIIGASYLQEKLFPNHHFSFPFQDAIIAALETPDQKWLRGDILRGEAKAEYKLSVIQHLGKMGMTGLYTVGLSALVFGGVVGLLIQANAQMKIARIRRSIYNENWNQTEEIPDDKLVGHFIHPKKNEDPLVAYKNWSSDLSSPKDAAVNGFLSATTAKLITLVPKLIIGTIIGLTIGAFQTFNQYKLLQKNEDILIPSNEFDIYFAVTPDPDSKTIKAVTTKTTKELRDATRKSLEESAAFARANEWMKFFKERFAKQPATKAVTDSLLHLAAPAFWLGFLVVPPLVAVQLTDFYRNKIGIVPPNHYHHFHLNNWLKRWSYANERTNAIVAGKQATPQPTMTSSSTEKKPKEATSVALADKLKPALV